MAEQTFTYDDGEYRGTASIDVPEGATVVRGIERVETRDGTVFVGPAIAMNGGIIQSTGIASSSFIEPDPWEGTLVYPH